MTDNEIIKALECCVTNGDCRECALNPKKGNYGYCTGLAIKSALDLITRQKAEIERLRKDSKRLKKVQMQLDDLCKMHHIIKAEAYKECIEKVKMEAENATCVYDPDRPQADNMVYHISNIRLDNLLKEMVGDNK
jgi:flagellar basal body rod protein FlgC